MKKLILIFFFLSTTIAYGSVKSQIISNLISTENFKFEFKQKIEDKIESGSCIINYTQKKFFVNMTIFTKKF